MALGDGTDRPSAHPLTMSGSRAGDAAGVPRDTPPSTVYTVPTADGDVALDAASYTRWVDKRLPAIAAFNCCRRDAASCWCSQKRSPGLCGALSAAAPAVGFDGVAGRELAALALRDSNDATLSVSTEAGLWPCCRRGVNRTDSTVDMLLPVDTHGGAAAGVGGGGGWRNSKWAPRCEP